MGVDARIEDLQNSVNSTELETLKASLKIALDDPSFSAEDAKKMLLSTLMTSSAFNDDTLNDFQSLTPKGLKANTATTTRKGVVRHATDAELAAYNTSNMIPANKLDIVLNKLAEITDIPPSAADEYIASVSGGGSVSAFDASYRAIGSLRYFRGFIVVSLSGASSTVDITFKNINIPDKEMAAQVSILDRSIIACASIEPINGYLNRLKVNMSKSASAIGIFFNMIY